MDADFSLQAETLRHCEVAIVGAGPIGLMLANLLGAAGVEAVVLERSEGLVGIPRAIAYDPETLRLFSQVGLFDEIEDGLIQNPRVIYRNASGVKLMEMNPPRSLHGHSPIGTFYQPNFERALLNGLNRFASVRVGFAHNVTSVRQDATGVDLEIETLAGARALRAKFVVGCDGGTSPTREAIGAKLAGATYTERWLVVDARVKNHNVDTISFFCDPRRPAVQLPAVGSRVRWEFMQLPGESTQELMHEETVRSLLAPYVDLSRVEIERKTVYAFHARVADRWREGRVLLAGDAAHLMPPFAGQGMNSGMKDVANLGWKLAAVVAGEAGTEILTTYETERAKSVRAMVALSRRLGAIIMPTHRGIAGARDFVLGRLNTSTRFRRFVMRGGLLPPPAIGRSALTGAARDAVIGQMAPQPEVSGAEGAGLLDGWLGCHQWCALGVGTDPATHLSPRDRSILDALGARLIGLNVATASPTLNVRCDDADFLAWAKRHHVGAILVRPDRFIAERLDGARDLRSLDAFAPALQAASAVKSEPMRLGVLNHGHKGALP